MQNCSRPGLGTGTLTLPPYNTGQNSSRGSAPVQRVAKLTVSQWCEDLHGSMAEGEDAGRGEELAPVMPSTTDQCPLFRKRHAVGRFDEEGNELVIYTQVVKME